MFSSWYNLFVPRRSANGITTKTLSYETTSPQWKWCIHHKQSFPFTVQFCIERSRHFHKFILIHCSAQSYRANETELFIHRRRKYTRTVERNKTRPFYSTYLNVYACSCCMCARLAATWLWKCFESGCCSSVACSTAKHETHLNWTFNVEFKKLNRNAQKMCAKHTNN